MLVDREMRFDIIALGIRYPKIFFDIFNGQQSSTHPALIVFAEVF
jgi:hypothetical protein